MPFPNRAASRSSQKPLSSPRLAAVIVKNNLSAFICNMPIHSSKQMHIFQRRVPRAAHIRRLPADQISCRRSPLEIRVPRGKISWAAPCACTEKPWDLGRAERPLGQTSHDRFSPGRGLFLTRARCDDGNQGDCPHGEHVPQLPNSASSHERVEGNNSGRCLGLLLP